MGSAPLVGSYLQPLAWIQISFSPGMRGKRAPAVNGWCHTSSQEQVLCCLTHQDPLPAWLACLHTQVTAWNSQTYFPWLAVTSPTARSAWSPCYFPLIPVLCLCSWCSWTCDKLVALCRLPEPLSDLQTVGHILPLPSLSLLCTIKPTAASKPSTSVGSLWHGTEKMICLVELCFLGRLKSLRTWVKAQVLLPYGPQRWTWGWAHSGCWCLFLHP